MRTLVGLCIGLTLCVFPETSSAQIRAFIANGAPLEEPPTPGGGSEASGGDVFWTIYCWADLFYPDNQLSTTLIIYVDGTERMSASAQGESYITVDAQVTVRGSSEDRTVSCGFTSNVGYQEVRRGTIPGSGPNSATIKMAAFIRHNWVGNPQNIYRVFGGDDRGFGYYEGSVRFATIADVYNPGLNYGDFLFGPDNGSSMTTEYDIGTSLDAIPPFGRLTDDARNDWVWDPPLKTRWQMPDTGNMGCSVQRFGQNLQDGTSTNEMHCTANVSDPLIWLAPAAKWDLTIRLTWGNRKIHYEVSGCHSAFPAFEAYANGSAFFQHPGSDSPSDIVYGCITPVSVSGDIQ